MYSMLKNIIVEKDIRRQILMLEQLLNHRQITARNLAKEIHTTERTVFSDLQVIKAQLPDGWQIETDSAGIRLISQQQLTNELWELFLPQSVGVQLLKELFFEKKLTVPQFLRNTGISFETLRRYTKKINQQLTTFHISIQLTATEAQLIGNETAIRVFYHRLLVPFTHNNYFFTNYSIHESNYFRFLEQLNQSDLAVETEQIFGACWFFINIIRIKAGCRIDEFIFDKEDALFDAYAAVLTQLYKKEGVYLQENESFFAFFCFLESWNYNNHYGSQLAELLRERYDVLNQLTQQFVKELADSLALPKLKETDLAVNLLIVLLKYNESLTLSEQFQLEYQELVTARQQHLDFTEQNLTLLDSSALRNQISDPTYLLNLMALLQQQAIFSVQPQLMTVYFVFQGEPAWKAFLQQELADYLGKRITLNVIEFASLAQLDFQASDIVVSNFPLDHLPIPVFYISTMPTKNELQQLKEFTLGPYLY
ncbi:HTH domain-containing protein [Erwinia sp. CPCC 100877]|nr:HTH domain-containing protein [Erwinia sp. CPCC 100877]